MKRVISLIAFALASTTLAAQDTALPEPEPAEIRQYVVEIIIFKYLENISVGSEIFVPELLEESDAIPTFGDDTDIADDSLPEDDPELGNGFAVQTLPPEKYRMQESYGRLSRLQAYRPLMHFGWIQQTVPDAEPPELKLLRFGDVPEGLDGSVSLKLSRYLHLDIDISLLADDAAPAGTPPGLAESEFAYGDDDTRRDTRQYAPLRYEIDETRIMKIGETRYYDHPKFGVIAVVTRLEDADAAP